MSQQSNDLNAGSLKIPAVDKRARLKKAESTYTPEIKSNLGSPSKLNVKKRRNSGEFSTKAEKFDFLKEYSQFNMSAIQSNVINRAAEKKRP